jgi:WD40 repeat protein
MTREGGVDERPERRWPRAFLTYAREHRDVVAPLTAALAEVHVTLDGDWNLETGRKYEPQIDQQIVKADTLLFLIADESLQSEPCLKELKFAADLKKKVIPVRYADPNPTLLPPELKDHHWAQLTIEGRLDFADGARQIQTALATDFDLVEEHTDLTHAALAWKAGRGPLLTGDLLAKAKVTRERLAAVPAGKLPALTKDVERYLDRCEQAVRRRVLWSTGSAGLALVGALGVFVVVRATLGAERAESKARKALATVRLPGHEASSIHDAVLAAGWAVDTRHSVMATVELALSQATTAYRASRPIEFGPGAVTASAVSADGDWFALANGRSLGLWNAHTGRREWLFTSADGPRVTSVALSAHGNRFAACDAGRCRVWDVASGGAYRSLVDAGMGEVIEVSFANGDAGLVALDAGGWARSWTLGERAGDATLRWRVENASRISVSPNGSSVLFASSLRTASIRPADSAAEPLSIPAPGFGSIASLRWSGDERRVVIGTDRGYVATWDVATHALTPAVPVQIGPFWDAATSPCGDRIAFAGRDGNLTVLDAVTLAVVARSTGHFNAIGQVTFSPDGRWIATASWDLTARIWSASNGILQRTFIGHSGSVTRAKFVAGGSAVLTTSVQFGDGTARLWSMESGASTQVLRSTTPARCAPVEVEPALGVRLDRHVNSVAFSQDDRRVVTAHGDGIARIWDVGSGERPRVLTSAGPPDLRLLHASFSTDGTMVATARSDGRVEVWSTAGRMPPVSWPVTDDPHKQVNTVSFTRDGTRLVTAGNDNSVRMWRLEECRDGDCRSQWGQSHGDLARAAVLSPDGRRVASASWDRTVRLWDAADGHPVCDPMRHAGRVLSVAVSATHIATASRGGFPQLWNAATCVREREFIEEGHIGEVDSVAFTADGSRLVTGGYDGTARVWEVETGHLIRVLGGHSAPVWFATPSHDGLRVATAGADGLALIHQTSFAHDLAEACELLAEQLTNDRELNAACRTGPEQARAVQWPNAIDWRWRWRAAWR